MDPPRIRVKICGLTRPEDARIAAEAGADAIGLNFVAGPRQIDLPRANAIVENLPDQMEAWALFDVGGHELPGTLRRLAALGRVTRVQMYGRVLPGMVERLHDQGLQTVAVRHVDQPGQLAGTSDWLRQFGNRRPTLLLVDSGTGKRLGGTGEAWDWAILGEMRDSGSIEDWPPLVLAGGLRPENVADAVRSVSPAWVDVSSGVEQSPGVKDAARVRAFVEAATTAQPS